MARPRWRLRALNSLDGRLSMKFLNNLSVTAKSLIATLVGMLAVGAIAGLATTSLLQIQRTTAATNAAVTV